jgi:hypothetical protein
MIVNNTPVQAEKFLTTRVSIPRRVMTQPRDLGRCITLRYTEFQGIFVLPPEISMTQRASLPPRMNAPA